MQLVYSKQLCTHTMLYSTVKVFQKNFIMNALMENSVWPWNLSTLENKSHEWLFPFLSRRSHYRLIELMIGMKRIQKHSYHMLSPSKFMPFEANSPSSKTPQFVMHPCTCSCSLYIQANTASRLINNIWCALANRQMSALAL